MLMACLEWFLWLAAFTYCLFKVFQKAEHWSIRVLCILVGLAFVLLRYVCGCSTPRSSGVAVDKTCAASSFCPSCS